MNGDSWYSDAALAKQAALEARSEDEPRNWTDLIGIFEPRTPPTDAERCTHCSSDAREGAGGDGRFCGLCLSRGRDEDYA